MNDIDAVMHSMQLARFVSGVSARDMPASVMVEAQRALLNGLAAGLGGAQDVAIDAIVRTLRQISADGSATLIGRSARLDPSNAAFVNAATINVLDFDDSHEGTVIHPTAPVAAAVLALSEARGFSGEQALVALALGIEVACRIGNAVSPGHYARGWHITGTCGIFGAAAACARLLDLDARQTLWALGSASAQSAGLVETLGTMAKSVGVGHAARGGMLAALMASNGVAGPDAPLEGRLGFLPVTCDDPKPEALVDGLGEHWEMFRNTYKPYPSGIVLNPLIDACLELHTECAVAPDAIASITIEGNRLLWMRTNRVVVPNGRIAQVSAQHAAAVCLLRGSAGAEDFSDTATQDCAIVALRAKVGEVIVTDAIPDGAVRVTVALNDGRSHERVVEHARGSVKRPLSNQDIEAKLAALARFATPALDPKAIVTAVRDLPPASDMSALMAALRPAATA